jgi:hypothetical protein
LADFGLFHSIIPSYIFKIEPERRSWNRGEVYFIEIVVPTGFNAHFAPIFERNPRDLVLGPVTNKGK